MERIHADVKNQLLTELETSELREQFIAVLGHDLRTPLGALQNGVELMRLKFPDPVPLPIVDRMYRSIGRINAMVDDVVDFTRGRMGGGISLDLCKESDISVPLNQVIDELCNIHPEQKIVRSVQSNLTLFCDLGRLGQLLSNLLKNAIVHGDAHKPITVAVTKDTQNLVIEVSNHGKHLSSDLINQLFKPFMRIPSNGAHQGLGLGLFIVKQIAKSHGGEMRVISEQGLTTFQFYMPVVGE